MAVVVEVRHAVGTPGAGPVSGTLELTPFDGGGEPVELPVEEVGAYRIAAAAGSIWRVRLSVAGHWAAEEAAVAGGPPVVLHLFPTGGLAGTLTLPPRVTSPETLHVSFEPPPQARRRGRSAPAGRVDCPVEERTWTCALPAGLFDLRFHAPGFASALRWEVRVRPGVDTLAEPVLLVPGAALLGRVLVEDGGDPAAVEIELAPAGAAAHDRESASRLGQLFRTVGLDQRGFFQFEDLGPGMYRVEARLAGHVPSVREPVEVIEGRETELVTPLVVTAPSELLVLLDPSVPPDGSYGWTVQLHGLDGSNSLKTVRADPTGAADVEALAPGRYRLVVAHAHSHWISREIEIASGRNVVEIAMPVVAVEGTVRRGDRPVRARLDFGGVAPRFEKVSIYADPEGRFSGHLPAEGEWPLAAILDGGGARQQLEPVEVVRAPGDDVARLDVELFDTSLLGRVIDADGHPVDAALILASREGSRIARSRVKSDDEGRFRFTGLRPGRWRIEAFAPPRGGSSTVTLAESSATEVELRLRGERRIRGRIVSDLGRVAGAQIYAVPEVPRTTPLAPFRSDPLGSFEVQVPEDASAVHLLVLPVGRAAKLLRVPLGSSDGWDGEIAVFADQLAGTLRLQLPPGGGRVELARGRARVPVQLLRRWAGFAPPSAQDGIEVWTVAGMEPGAWSLCRAADCIHGVFPPGGDLELSLAGEAVASAREPGPGGR